jgi:hypothetical protein
MSITDRPTCHHCEAPAAYVDRRGEPVCADCGCWWGAFANGERYGAVQLLGFAVERMRAARFTSDQIRDALEATLRTGSPPERLVAAEEHDDRWLHAVVPISAFHIGGEA